MRSGSEQIGHRKRQRRDGVQPELQNICIAILRAKIILRCNDSSEQRYSADLGFCGKNSS